LLQQQKTSLKNIKHSKESSYEVQKMILSSNTKLINEIDKQIVKLKLGIENLIKQDIQLSAKVDNLMTIKGVGILTIATVIAETLGFQFVQNVKQLTSFAGYDVIQRESGTSVKGKTRISKKGNSYIRNALYFPAMAACRYNENLKEDYLRIIQKKSSKMIGQVAIQRKLLILMYTLWKNDEVYDSDYHKKTVASQINSEATQDRVIETSLP
jgi:transposase